MHLLPPRKQLPLIPLILTTLLLLAPLTTANVEKTIFLAPSPTLIPNLMPPIDDLGLPRLSPSHAYSHHRTKLNASFPTPDSPGTDSWFFLEHLVPGKRYEVRICWLATQPTTFDLKTYTLPTALETADLLAAITTYSTARLAHQQHQADEDNDLALLSDLDEQARRDTAPIADSVLFLRVRAAADYFSTDPELMANVPPVLVDVILDPYLGNIFPRSLVPTAAWVVVVAVGAVLVGRWVVAELGRVVDTIASEDEQGQKQQDGDEGRDPVAKKVQ
ncbi:uncharacterized protein BO97DRAFT_391087 [Aspergillus homomorphus CBS 101889]|uniref:GPI-Mannosyltransferase II co-activator n=1 Tax=Aspergillus homomorphus (strain CBS 101889) TaxID=1450537 RepID=A0A395HYZ1_ASPHC|nr:hypothetical protein BO97DRAFT_391087 [Aspergillus homomorphus CBS 101889]RAL12088.1 hypothetical protein BO97DRAFT_391087 [Aspergillus homomorphus CBS 101889]